MAPKDKTTASSDNAGAAPDSNLADQILLKALQDFIVPLIRAVGRKRKNDINPTPLGPEAGKLIAALREFISSIAISSHSDTQNTIEASLVEEEHPEQGDPNDEDEDEESPLKGPLRNPPQETSYSETYSGDVSRADNSESHEKLQPKFHERLLTALREHVFNTMPIRLLCFEPYGTNLQITLLERGVVHTRLASALRAKIHDTDHAPKFSVFLNKMETEKEAIERLIAKYTRYAILSHTWLRTASGEITYGDWNKGLFDAEDPGYLKLVNFCKTAWKVHGLAFGWMDTVCINKESSAELDESIRSMYNWYRRACICIIFLSETKAISNMHMDPWFTRGWTLQELLAPDAIKFYNGDWKELVEYSHNDRMHIQITKQIERATTISEDELTNIRKAPISRRMHLAANREVTREEDIAYSLMGIFDVSISTAYGEGAERAFLRLLQEILISSENVLDILNWAGKLPDSRPHPSSLLPSGPQYYLSRSSNDNLLLMRPIEPLILTHLGLRIPVILMPAISISDTQVQCEPVGSYSAIIDIDAVGYYNHIPTGAYHVLEKRISGSDGQSKYNNYYQVTLAVFNFDGNENNICIPKICAAIGLRCYEPAGKVTAMGYIDTIDTEKPIVFNLNKVTPLEGDDPDEDNTNDIEGDDDDDDDLITDWNKGTYYCVRRSDLIKHGMQLLSLYL